MFDALTWLTDTFFPSLIGFLNGLFVVDGVSYLGFIVAIGLLSIIIGAIAIRV